MPHIDDGLLHAHLDGALAHVLPAAEAAAVARHLAGCADCRARLEHERALRTRAHGLLADAGPAGREPPPFESLRARPAPRPRRRALPLAWAATVVLALGAGWMARAALQPSDPAETMRLSVATPESVELAEPVESAAAGAAAAERVETVRLDAAAPPSPAAAATDAAPAPARSAAPAAPPAAAPPPPTPAPYAVAPQPQAAVMSEARATEATASPALVRGRVTDTAGRPLAGALVRVEGTAAGGIARADGGYTVVVPAEEVAGRDSVVVRAQVAGYAAAERAVSLAPDAAPQEIRLEPAAVALESLVVTGAPAPAEGWRTTDAAGARSALGRPLRVVAGLPLAAVELREVEGRTVVRVRQPLQGGGELRLEQRAEPAAAAQRRRAASPAASGAAESGAAGAAQDAGWSSEVLSVDGLRIEARAPLPPAELRRLLRRLEAARP